ncbi:unnamed protein product [Sphenostylis stenocarpa]|uniref:Uncharacterized protein n=1 Tax=Sphenostylis stenocarpa TaxID=92480 RepID=A0AA86SCJ7_9FABA|nr:unnamed protein product [Sphenostylis stenocarpa]
MFMLPMMGRPFGPGGYGAVFLRIRDSKPISNNVTGIMNKTVVGNGSSALSCMNKSMA